MLFYPLMEQLQERQVSSEEGRGEEGRRKGEGENEKKRRIFHGNCNIYIQNGILRKKCTIN